MLKLGYLSGLFGILIIPTFVQASETMEEQGKVFAKAHCSECHRISPGELATGHFDAPSFQSIANDPAVTEMSLNVFLRTPHSRMPDLMLSEPQKLNLIAYILSLK